MEGVWDGGETCIAFAHPPLGAIHVRRFDAFCSDTEMLPSICQQGMDPGTHVAKLELPAALGSRRRPQKAQGYFAPLSAFPAHRHVCAYTRRHKHTDAPWGRSNGLGVAWQQEGAQQAGERNGISLGEGGRKRNK